MTYNQIKVYKELGKSIETFETAVQGLNIDMEAVEVDSIIK